MGQKVSPIGLRVGINKDWQSKWYAEKDYAKYLHEDIKIRKLIETKLKEAIISIIQKTKKKKSINYQYICSRQGVHIGQDGKIVEKFEKNIKKIVGDKEIKINVNLVLKKNKTLDAREVSAQWICNKKGRAFI